MGVRDDHGRPHRLARLISAKVKGALNPFRSSRTFAKRESLGGSRKISSVVRPSRFTLSMASSDRAAFLDRWASSPGWLLRAGPGEAL